MTVAYRAWYSPHERIRLDAGAGASLFEHSGLSNLGMHADAIFLPDWDFGLKLGVHHEQWNDWRIGENRAVALLHVQPLERLDLGLGVAWRAPIFDPDRYSSPLVWQSEMPEANMLVRISWRFLDLERLKARLALSNLETYRVTNPHHIPLHLDASYELSPRLHLIARCGTAVKGISALLLSVSEYDAGLGIHHAF